MGVNVIGESLCIYIYIAALHLQLNIFVVHLIGTFLFVNDFENAQGQ